MHEPFESVTVTPRIKQGATDITGQTQNVIVGQQISLTSVVPLSGNTITSQSWTIPGTIVGGYAPSANSAAAPASVNTTVGSVTFYWVDGADGRQVTYSATLNDGKMYKAVTTFNVKRPTGSMSATAEPSSAIVIGTVQTFLAYEYGTATAGNSGVHLVNNYSIPTGFSGSFEWAQVVTSSTVNRTSTTGVSQSKSCVGGDSYPYDTKTPTDDSPFEELLTGYKENKRSDGLSMWLMFKPTAGTSQIWGAP